MFKEIFGVEKPIIGMVHFPPMPGSPLYDQKGGITKIFDSIDHDLRALQYGKVDAVMFCNEGERPYKLGPADSQVIATMASVIGQLKHKIEVPFGCDILWDPCAALALAKAVGGIFVREVFTGVYASDMGLWNANGAANALRFRRAIDAEHIKVFYNINAEFAGALGDRPIEKVARSVVFSSIPDAVCVSGPMTGSSADLSHLVLVKEAIPHTPLIANTGVRANNVQDMLSVVDAAIVGTAFKQDGDTWKPVDPERVVELMTNARKTNARESNVS